MFKSWLTGLWPCQSRPQCWHSHKLCARQVLQMLKVKTVHCRCEFVVPRTRRPWREQAEGVFGGGGNIGGHSTWQTAGNVGAADLCNRDSNVRREIQLFSRTLEEEIGWDERWRWQQGELILFTLVIYDKYWVMGWQIDNTIHNIMI